MPFKPEVKIHVDYYSRNVQCFVLCIIYLTMCRFFLRSLSVMRFYEQSINDIGCVQNNRCSVLWFEVRGGCSFC